MIRRLWMVMIWVTVLPAVFAQESPAPAGLQDGFRELRLGITIEAAKEALGRDPNFAYRGDPDVSFLPGSGLPIIETAGVAFVERAILQFSEDRLYVLTLVMNEARLDYYGVYTELVAQYGDPSHLDPGMAAWESDVVRISLERPLTLKYIDLATFRQKLEDGTMAEALETLTRERFLEQL